MGKKIKLITTLLLISMLCGAGVIFISASSATPVLENQLIPSGATNIYSTDFENGNNAGVTPDGNEVPLAYNNKEAMTVYGDLGADRYMSIVNNPDYQSAAGGINYSVPLTPTSDVFEVKNYDFVVFDMDISTDKYYWEATQKTYTVAEYEADVDGVKTSGEAVPAYLLCSKFGPSFAVSSSQRAAFFSISRDSEGKAYISYSSVQGTINVTSTPVYLSNEVNAVDHLTLIVKANATNANIYLYLNGEHFATIAGKGLSGLKSAQLKLNRFDFIKDDGGTDTDSYSMCFDNITLNAYAKGYTSSAETNLTNFSYDSASLTTCSGIVYDADYLKPGMNCVSYNGKKVPTSALANVLLAELESGGRVVANGVDIVDFTPPTGLSTFEVLCANGATVSLSEEGDSNYKGFLVGDTYTFYEMALLVELRWFDNMVDGKLLATEYAAVGMTLDGSKFSVGDIDEENGTYRGVKEWIWCLDGILNSGESYPEAPIGTLTDKDFTISKAVANGVVSIYPVYNETGTPLAYSVKDSDGDLYIAEGDTLQNYTNIININNSIAKAPSGATVTIYGDGETVIEISEAIVVGESKELFVDLYGQKISAASNLFTLSEYSNLNVYSSVAGAEICEADAVVYIPSTVSRAMVILGQSDDGVEAKFSFDTNGVTVICAEAESSVTASNKQIWVGVAGGIHYVNSDALFDINSAGVVVYAVDTTLVAGAENNSADAGAIFSDFAYTMFVSSNSTLVGAFSESDNAGGMVAFSGNNTVASSITSLDGEFAFLENTKYARNNSAANFVKVGEVSATVEFLTFTAEAPEGVCKVNWLKPDGITSLANSEYWMVGSTPEAPSYDQDDFSGALNNGWFDIEYDGWQNEEGTLVVLNKPETSFTPKASLVANVTGAKMNVSLYSNASVNVYIPVPENTNVVFTQDGVHLDMLYNGKTGFSLSEGGEILTDNLVSLSYQNGEYYGVRTYIAAHELDGEVTLYVNFIVTEYDVNGNGTIEDNEKNIALSQELKTSFLAYISTVASMDEFACGTEGAKLVFDLLSYKRECYKLYNGIFDNNVPELEMYNEALDEGHGDTCKCKTDITNLEFTREEQKITTSSYSELSEIMSGIGFKMDADAPCVVFYVPKTVGSISITVTIEGVKGAFAEQTIRTVALLTLDEDGEPVVATVDDEECYVYCYKVNLLCNANEVMEIKATTSEGTKTGRYCLAEYIEQNPNITAAKALYAAAVSSYNYKVD